MKYRPYEFKRQDAYDFANFVHIQARESNGQLHFVKCPMCGQTTDDKKTFAISLRTGQFKCLRASCGYEGNMITLSQDFDFSLGNEVDEYIAPKRQFKTYRKKTVSKPTDRAIEYLKGRGISEETAKRYEITARNDKPDVLVFQFIKGDEICLVKYRDTKFDKSKGGNKEWCEAKGKPVLFGMQCCKPENKTLVICEGQIDSLSVAESGIDNAVSVPTGARGFTWVPYCWDWMQNFENIIVFGDYEKGYMTLLDDIKMRFKAQRIKHVRYDDYMGCKDANEILQKYGRAQVKKCVENAEEEPIHNVIALKDVKQENPYEMPKAPTGFIDLDRQLKGGLPFGGITILTGKTGEGKSIVASQILLNCLDKGHKIFAYSGELPQGTFKAIMELQAAGSHLFSYRTHTGYEGYNISENNRALINAWFGENIYLYDDQMLDDSETESLTKIIEKMIVRYGVDVILIDNMMTGLDLEMNAERDKYERQSAFVKRLARIARSYNVLILLVAHLRKNNGSVNGNDEVAGSSDVTNLASVTLMYETDPQLSPDQRLLKVWKDRIFGNKNTSGWTMNYDQKSKRVYGPHDDLSRDFGWIPEQISLNTGGPSTKADDFIKASDMEDIPF